MSTEFSTLNTGRASGLNDLGGLISAMGLAERIKEAIGDKSPADIARATGKTPGAVTQWLDGTIKSLKADTAALLEEATGYRASWIVTGKGAKRVAFQDEMPSFSRVAQPTMQPILSWEHEDELPPGEFVMIRRLGVHLSAGAGKEQLVIEFTDQQPQAFRADWIRRERLKPNKLASMIADGDSMEDRIHDGDALVVDTSQTEVRDGKVYALWYDGGERVKRLFRLPGGGLRIHSDNDSKYPEIVLKPEELELVRIIGRVVHTSGTGGL